MRVFTVIFRLTNYHDDDDDGADGSQAENLQPPWGDCRSMELEFYPEYVHSSCIRECETTDVLKQCGCRDAYMPGYSYGQSTVIHIHRQTAVLTTELAKLNDATYHFGL